MEDPPDDVVVCVHEPTEPVDVPETGAHVTEGVVNVGESIQTDASESVSVIDTPVVSEPVVDQAMETGVALQVPAMETGVAPKDAELEGLRSQVQKLKSEQSSLQRQQLEYNCASECRDARARRKWGGMDEWAMLAVCRA